MILFTLRECVYDGGRSINIVSETQYSLEEYMEIISWRARQTTRFGGGGGASMTTIRSCYEQPFVQIYFLICKTF